MHAPTRLFQKTREFFLTRKARGVARRSGLGACCASLVSLVLLSAPGPAEPSEGCSYRLGFSDARHHYVEVEGRFPTQAKEQLELFLPVWTPGSYMVREYSRQVEGVQAFDSAGHPLKWEKSRKNRWRVHCPGASQVVLKYRVYCREMSVRNAWVDDDFALLVGAQLFIAPTDSLQRHYQVELDLPPHWKKAESGLTETGKHQFGADSYDVLIDCPILAGNPAVYDFQVGGIPHRLVNQGEDGVWDGPRSAQDVEKIVSTVHQMWRDVPYHHYHFFNVLTQSGGGLEHRNSTVMMSTRWSQHLRQDYLKWLGLVAHEFFHAWNVKTLRPAALGPFDYENEVYTPSLWVAEGFTAYYDNLMVRRAGFSSHKEYLQELSKDIEALQTGPGHAVQSLRYSSYDAWIKYYRPDENSPNSGISYYTKGALVAFLLDARIRQLTQGQRCLDDVMRRAYQLYSGPHGYTEAQFRAVAEEVAGAPLASFFESYVDGLEELDYQPALRYYGLRFKPEVKSDGKDPEPAWLGAQCSAKGGRLLVTQVRRGTPAFEAGLCVDDELVALGDLRIPPDGLDDRLKHYAPGAQVDLWVARRDRMRKLSLKLGKKPADSWQLEIDPQASPEAQQQRKVWLGPDLKN